MPYTVTTNTTIASNQTLNLGLDPVFGIEILEANSVTLTNLGVININAGSSSGIGIEAYVGSTAHQTTFINALGATFTMTTSGQAGATGFRGSGDNIYFVNNGSFSVSAANGWAQGVELGGDDDTVNLPSFVNTGTLTVTGANQAFGVQFRENGVFVNSGTVQVTGGDGVIAVATGGAMDFNNSGTITATSTTVGEASIGVFLTQGVNYWNEIGVYVNSGLIQADWAFLVDQGYYSTDALFNTGQILGDIKLDKGMDQLNNAGSIVGDVDLGDDEDFYNGQGGTLDGVVWGGAGADRLVGGASTENLFGGEGNDTLAGGGGDDFLDGGSGSDAIDGGAGYDTLSYVAAAGAMIINLSTGAASGSGSDRLAGFERVLGTAQADHITGGTGAETLEGRGGADTLIGANGTDTLIGGAGADTLTGGAGNDSYTFSIGDGADTVTDFVAGGTDDVLRIHGYTAYQSLQQVGADTRVVLSGTDSILLKNVTVGSLTSADFVFTAAPLVVAPTPPGPPPPITSNIYEDLIVVQGEVYTLPQTGITLRQNLVNGDYADVFNSGTIVAAATSGGIAGITVETGGYNIVSNLATGVIDISTTGTLAWGYYGTYFPQADFWNAGLFKVTALNGEAGGAVNMGSSGSDWVNSGTFQVTAGTTAIGVSSHGSMWNSGAVTVVGDHAIAFAMQGFNFNFVNSGQITVDGNTQTTAISHNAYGPYSIWNSGLIDATGGKAIEQGAQGSGGDEFLYNTGTIKGSILSNLGQAWFYNWGTIEGTIQLGESADTYDGRGGNHVGTVFGGNGDDTLLAGAGANTLDGGAGVDILSGGAGGDTITSGAGSDFIRYEAGGGADTVTDFTAGAGGDVLVTSYASYQSAVQQGANTLITFAAGATVLLQNVTASALVAGNFQYSAAALSLTPAAPTPPDTPVAPTPPVIPGGSAPAFAILGDSGANTLMGTVGIDTILGDAGADIIEADDGDDWLSGGLGADLFVYRPGDGNDTIYDLDIVAGDLLLLHNFSDVQMGGGYGGMGLVVQGGAIIKVLGPFYTFEEMWEGIRLGQTGGAGADTLTGTIRHDWIDGAGGNDVLSGGVGKDRLRGQDGDDTLNGGTGNDELDGGLGVDTADYTGMTMAVTLSLAIVGGQTGSAEAGMDLLTSIENLIGTGFNDALTGNTLANRLDGMAGNDTLKGDAGDDVLNGGDGNDLIEGAAGNDIMDGGAGTNDKVDYRAAGSAVTVNLSLLTAQNTVGAGTDTLSGFEQVLGSAFNDTLTGDGFNNTLDGKNGNDTLNGGSGGDILIGGLGADAMNGGGDLDYASYINAVAGVGINLTTGVHSGEALGDTFVAIERYRLGAFNDTFVGSAATDYAYGAEGADTLSGAGGIDRLYGQDGNDTLNGDAGNDILLGGAGADAFNGGADRDTASYEESTVAITINLATGVHTNDALGDTFASIEILWLSAFNDTFTGGSAADEVRGAAGVDTMNGGLGADILRGEDGNDVLKGQDGDDMLHGGNGADAMDGGLGVDTASYLLATSGVGINLTTGSHAGEATGDTFASIERFQLSNIFAQNDSFTGSAGDDWVAGYKGVDNINGMDGADTLNGGDHNDVLNGGNGDDKLIGEGGNDSLTGGAGADQFRVTTALFGADTVADFQNGVDKIRVTGVAGWDNFNDVVVSSNGSGWAVITFPDGSSITLTGVVAGLVDATDFLWA